VQTSLVQHAVLWFAILLVGASLGNSFVVRAPMPSGSRSTLQRRQKFKTGTSPAD
jgi:hypothetical protein